MANEATVNSSLQVRKVSGSTVLLDYQSRPSAFKATVNGTKGPYPGSLSVPTTGKLVYFDQLTTPGLCRLMNCDATNYVEYGIYDPQSGLFYPIGEMLPGETYVLRFSRNLQEQYSGSGTGTATPENYFYMKANKATCVVLVEAFEK